MDDSRDTCVFLAKLAEQAERYDEMVSGSSGWVWRQRVGSCWGTANGGSRVGLTLATRASAPWPQTRRRTRPLRAPGLTSAIMARASGPALSGGR